MAELIEVFGRTLVTHVTRSVLAEARGLIQNGINPNNVERRKLDEWTNLVETTVVKIANGSLRKVINLSGVVSHTNLGRALIPKAAANAAAMAAQSNINLEYNLQTGIRGDRDDLVEELLKLLTGAEAATIVNNNAAAVLLCLNSLSEGCETIVSRGELIEIGGSFRLPEIMAKSGCILREVGTTNRTHYKDFQSAISEKTALILQAHTSNYRIIGYTTGLEVSELAKLSKESKIPVMVDLGSGALLDLEKCGLPHEKTVTKILKEGADLVTFSCDKLLGGPQAGIIAGRYDLVQQVKENHMRRALRCDKMTLAALQAVLRVYLDPDKAWSEIPTLTQLARSVEELTEIAERVSNMISLNIKNVKVSIIDDTSMAGSGALPEIDIPSVSVAISHGEKSPNELAKWFRGGNPAIIGRVENDLFRLNIRSLVIPDGEEALADAIHKLVNN
tara:strand:- start:130497 stop:131840 length:1344 start_codon:yes stop_codon:yes gene_type:complete